MKSWSVQSWVYGLGDCWGPYGFSGSVLVADNCTKVGGVSLCADRKTKDPDSETYTFSGNVNLDGKLLFSDDVVFKAPSAGASTGVLTTSGAISVKLKNGQETLLTGTGMNFDLDGTAGTLTPKLTNRQWATNLAGIPLWVSGKPITLGADGVKIEPTLYIGTTGMTLASFKASLLYVPGGDKKLQGFELIQGQLSPGIQFFGMSGNYDSDKDIFTGSVSVGFPFMGTWAASATIRIKSSCSANGAGLNGCDISIGLPDPIPLGTTGLGVAGFTLKVDNICDIPKFLIFIGGDLGIAGVPGEIFTLSQMGLGYERPYRLNLEGGTANLLGFPVGSLSGRISFKPNFAGVTFKGWTNFAGIYQSSVNGMLSVSKKTITGSTSGTLQIPDFSCSWVNVPCRTLKTAVSSVATLPLNLNAAEMDMNIRSGANGWEGLFRGMQTVGPLSLAVQLQYADEAFDLLIGPNYADVIGLGVGKAAAAPLRSAGATRSVTLTAPQSQALFGVAAKVQSAAVPAIYLKNPQGATITSANVGKYPGVHYAVDKALKVALFRVEKAAAGTWTLGVTNLTAQQADFQMLAPAAMPTTTFTAVSATAKGVNLKAAVRPASANTKVSFFVGEEASGGVGQPIAENLSAASGVVSATWNTQGLKGGSHYLFARTDDGKNPPVVTYYANPVQTGASELKAPTNFSGACAKGICALKWAASLSSGVKGYRVLYTDQPALPGYPFTQTAAAGTSIQIGGLQIGGAYRFAVVAYDAAGNDSAPSAPWHTGAVPPAGVRQLQSGMPVSDSVAQGAWKFFRINVPSEPRLLEVYTANGSANVDLYLRKDAKPNASTYDYRATGATGNEAISVTSKSTPKPLSAGEWYLGVHGKQKATFAVGAKTASGSRCALTCAATVPAFAKPGVKTAFQGKVTPQNCTLPVSYAWTFGDKTPVALGQTVSHAYASQGNYIWTLTGVAGSAGCIASGAIVIGNTPPKVPGAPVIGKATAGNAQATVTFSPPVSNGGSPITGYVATSSPEGKTARGTASPLTVTGLANGTAYTFTVRAINAVGTGPASAASNSVKPIGTSTAPGAPVIGKATAGNAQATITFSPPTSNGGSPITRYTALSNPGGKTAQGTASPLTVSGLTNGTAYTFTVRATNAIGTGPASAPSNSVTPVAPSTEYGWRAEPNLPTGADWAGSAVAGNLLYVIGGGDYDHWNKIRIYNATNKTWSQKTVARMGYLLRAVAVSNRVYIFNISSSGANAWIYNLSTNALLPLGRTIPNLEWTSEPAVHNGKVYFFGGYGPQKTVWEFNPATLAFTRKADMPTAGYGASTAVLNGKIYVIGGNYRYNRIEIYDPATNTWAPSLAFANLMLWGWDTAAPVGGKVVIVEAGSAGRTFLFDPATRKITPQAATPRIHGDYLTGELVTGRLYVAGGKTGPRFLDSFLPKPLTTTADPFAAETEEQSVWLPLSELEAAAREVAEADYGEVEARHLRAIEQVRQKAVR